MDTTIVQEQSSFITDDSIEDFIADEADKGSSENALRRYRGAMKLLLEYLADDRSITRERLLSWREELQSKGYSKVTVQNYVKCINRYLDFAGFSSLRFNKGRIKDISGMEFGYLVAIEPLGKNKRGEAVWRFQCRCGKTVELPATRAITGNTLSCGCLKGDTLKATMKYCDGTSIVQSVNEKICNPHSVSGYVGVAPKKDKWQAYITYKGTQYSLGAYCKLEDAVKARARAKELVIADAQGLLDFYTELEKSLPQLPNKKALKKDVVSYVNTVPNIKGADILRSDNKSGYKGVYYHKGMWEARICYCGYRFYLGRFNSKEDAVSIRREAERDLSCYPADFVDIYSKRYSYHLS